MQTKITTVEELKQLFIETLLNNTDKITKVSNHSVVNGISYGIAKVGQKSLKDIALVEQNINPDMAYGAYLDKLASNWGIAPRFGASGSSTYIRVVGKVGTTYQVGVHTISSGEGVVFDIAQSLAIGSSGYAYVKVQSQNSGLTTNVKPFSLSQISPIPQGHTFLTNEYMATGGRDEESDESFRTRIKEGANIMASQTLSKLEQILIRENNDVLKIYRAGNDSLGNTVIKIATQNGSVLTPNELDTLLSAAGPYLALSDYRVYKDIKTYGVVFQNVDYEEVNIIFKAKIKENFDPDEVRINAQVAISKYFDFRTLSSKGILEWDDLFFLIKNTRGIEYISDASFKPNKDVVINKGRLPRVRSFLMYDLKGNIIADSGGNISPIYYPNIVSLETQENI